MTVLTKPFSEKKDNLVPLVNNDPSFTACAPGTDVEAQNVTRKVIIFPAQARRVSTSTILCLLIIALAGVSSGIIGGKILYNEFISVTRRMPMQDAYGKSQGWVRIPISQSDTEDIEAKDDISMAMKMLNNEEMAEWSDVQELKNFNKDFLQENFEIDAENKYEKIDVPDFKNGRNGRFIHDFNTNYTGIIDVTGSRCFIMPLNREIVLPPTSLFDLVHKMWDGYYKVNTEVVRETMRVVTPSITDTTDIGQYIVSECLGKPIYKLEKFVGGVVKRSANPDAEVKFGQFAGKGILELNIVNLDSVIVYENEQKNINK